MDMATVTAPAARRHISKKVQTAISLLDTMVQSEGAQESWNGYGTALGCVGSEGNGPLVCVRRMIWNLWLEVVALAERMNKRRLSWHRGGCSTSLAK
jgi:hypothetical protein